jgi:phosphatidate cytidylyltransferase
VTQHPITIALREKTKKVRMRDITKKKAWTGLLVVPPLILLIVYGPPVILPLMVLGATFLGLKEFYQLTLPHSKKVEHALGMGLGLMLSALMAFADVKIVIPFLVFILFSLSFLSMITSDDLLSAISKMGVTLLGILYVGFLLSHVSLIRNLVKGQTWVLFLIAVVWTGDISAFLGGSWIGRHKLYPKISPKKTVEGLVGAVLGSVLASLIFRGLFIPHLHIAIVILVAFILGLLGQLGDLTESMLKRSAQVKDSGGLLPGHGGMLDRLDSFLFTAPFLYYALVYWVKEVP